MARAWTPLLLAGLSALPTTLHARPRALEPLLVEVVGGDHTSAARAFPSSLLPDGRLRLLVRLAPGVRLGVALKGFDFEAAAGPVVPVRIAPDRLEELERRPGVVLVEASRSLRPQLDRSAPASGASVARQQYGLDGTGVVVGIVDTGIDFRHGDFLDQYRQTRVRFLLDFSIDGPTSKVQGIETYGAQLYTEEQINEQLVHDRVLGHTNYPLVLHRDSFGHGTHVAGIAAGTGREVNHPPRYVGMAPGATLIGVKASKGAGTDFSDAAVIHGIQFVFDRAAALNMPAVANISLGTQLGPHDGTSNLAVALSALTGPDKPGRIIVTAAGNDGGMDLHAMGFPAVDGKSEVVLEIPPYQPSSQRELVHLEIWYSDGDLSVTLTSPGGRSHGPVNTGGRLEELTPDGLVKILNAPGGAYKPNGRFKAVLIIDEREQVHPRSGRWVVGLTGSAGRFDVWLVNPGIQGNTGRPRLLGPLDNDIKLNSPATATGVISVGAYSLRGTWRSQEGLMGVASVQPEEHAYFSATGPTLDGRFLPDISAPGEFIISALSRHAHPHGPSSAFFVDGMAKALWHDNPTRALLRGTSQAAPHVTGAVALLLQRNPNLTLPEVRELLRVAARVDHHVGVGRCWSPRWGFGKLDVASAIAVLEGQDPGALDPQKSAVAVNRDLVPPGCNDRTIITVIPRGSTGLPLGPNHKVAITSSTGRVGPPTHMAYGRFEAQFYPEGEAGEVALIEVRVDGVPLPHTPRIHLSSRRALLGDPFQSSGGCGSAPLSDRSGVLGLLGLFGPLALLLLALRRSDPSPSPNKHRQHQQQQ